MESSGNVIIMKKAFKWVAVILAMPVVVFLITASLLYVPSIQNFAVDKVTVYASRTTGMVIRVDNVRLGFPLNLWVHGVEVLTEEQETLLTVETVRVDIQGSPLLKKQLEVDGILLKQVEVNTMEFIPTMELRGSLGEFYLSSHGVSFDPEVAVVSEALLKDTDLHIHLRDTTTVDTATVSEPIYWKILLEKLEAENVCLTLQTSDTTSLFVGWHTLQAVDGKIDLHTDSYQLQQLTVVDGNFAMDNDLAPAADGLDVNHLSVSGVQMTLDSLLYAGEQMRAVITDFAAKERSGMEIVSLQGGIYLDSLGVNIPQLQLETGDSYLEASVRLDWKALEMNSESALVARVLAELGKQDVLLLSGDAFSGEFIRQYPNQPLTLKVGVSGNMDKLNLTMFQAELKSAFFLQLDGAMSHLLDSLNREGALTCLGETRDLDFLFAMSDSLSSTFTLPPVSLKGEVQIAADCYTAELQATEGDGLLNLNASYRMGTEEYEARLEVDSLCVADFLPEDSVGYLSASLTAKGRGFDIYSPDMHLKVQLRLDQLEYAAYDLSDVALDVVMEGGKMVSALRFDNQWIQMNTKLETEIMQQMIDARLAMQVSNINLQDLQVTELPFQAQWLFSMDATTNLNDFHAFSGSLQNFRFVTSEGDTLQTKDLYFDTTLAPDSTCANIKAGDLNVHLDGKRDVSYILNALSAFSEELMRQLEAKWFDQNKLKNLLPELCLRIQAGQDNPLYNYMNLHGLRYDCIDLDFDTSPADGINGTSYIYSLRTDSLQLDTIRFNVHQDTLGVKTFAEIRNAPTNKQFVFDARLSSFIHPKGAAIELNYFNGEGEHGLHLGMNTSMVDDGVRFKFYPENPIIAFQEFTLNRDNYIQFCNDGRINANVELENQENRGFHLYSSDTDAIQDLSVDLYRLNLGELMTILPYLPNISGIWNAECHYMENEDGQSFVVETSIDSLRYERNPFGNVACSAIYLPEEDGVHFINASISRNEQEIVEISGNYHTAGDGMLDMNLILSHFPLALTNGFIPDRLITFTGDLDGDLNIKGKTDAPLLNGLLTFDSVSLASEVYGVQFQMDNRPIQIENSRLSFDQFSVYTQGENPFTLDGYVDFSDLLDARVDLQMAAHDYELINASRTKHSVVYGKVYVDFFSTLQGPLSMLKMRGNLNVQGSTDVTYVLKDSPLVVEDQLSDLVTFVNFNDTVETVSDEQVLINTGGIDMLMTLQISEGAHVRVDLSEDRESYISLYGGGTLSMQYTPQEELMLSGRYTVVSGEMKYALPIIPLKTFTIKNGSYVEFSGNPMNPRMNIAATERVRTTVTENDTPRSVNFDVGIAITNSLRNMGLEFTLEAPEDASLQNQLVAMSSEDRGKLAVAMLATGMYLGDSGTGNISGGFDANSALNSFLQSEITNIAGSALNTVDISFGMEDVAGTDGSQHKDYSFRFAKRFWNNRLSVVIGGRISTGDDAEDSGNSESFIDDISLEWRLDDSGTRYVRIFHNTTFDSMLDGEITETGGGIVLRRRMTKLGELFIFRKKRSAASRHQDSTTTEEQ